MVRTLFAAAILAALSTAAISQADVIAQRRDLMKGNGQAARLGGQLAKGEVPFDLAKAQEVFANFEKAAVQFPKLFPEDSKTGGQTTASPKVWEDMADFQKRFESWTADIKKASAETKDLEGFKTAFGNVTKACGSCHQVYRVKT